MTLFGDFVTGQTLSFQRMRALLLEGGGGLQEGVVGPTDLKVAQRGAGANMSVDIPAGAAWVQIDTGTRNGLAHVYNDATANVAVTASNATNPRIDQAILRYNDTSIPTGSGNTPTLEMLAGTATAGATLDNRTGAAALPNDCLRLADILVPAASTSVTTANIRDRRPWARGAYRRLSKGDANVGPFSSTAFGLITTVLQPRIECSGVPMKARLQGNMISGGAGAFTVFFDLLIDAAGVSQERHHQFSGTGIEVEIDYEWDFVPTAGTHVIAPVSRVNAQNYTVNASGLSPLVFSVEEIVRPNADNT